MYSIMSTSLPTITASKPSIHKHNIEDINAIGVINMGDFLVLIAEILLVVILQTIIEAVLEIQDRKEYKKVVNIACVLVCYLLLIRYTYNHLWDEISTLINFVV